MSFDAPSLLRLLPAIYATRDAERAMVSPGWLDPVAKGELATLLAQSQSGPALTPAQSDRLASLQQQALAGPLASLLAVIAEQFGVLEEDLAQLLDDQFIDTCAEDLVSYLGDLIGVRSLHDVGGGFGRARAEVAHTLGYRRRKGTVPVLEGIAHDASGWPAVAAEFFQRLVTTQYMNHRRLHSHAAPDLSRWAPLLDVGSAFDAIPRTLDVRRIGSRRGRHNIPNVGLFLWRLGAAPLHRSPAPRVDAQRAHFHPLGIDLPLFTRPDSTVARRSALDVPVPILRRRLHEHAATFLGDDGSARLPSLALYVDGQRIAASRIRASHLGDAGASWGNLPPAGEYAIDPELGRIGLPLDLAPDARIEVDFHYGAVSDLGGGEYPRTRGDDDSAPAPNTRRVPDDAPTIAQALADLVALGGHGVVEITDNARYAEDLVVEVAAGGSIEIRAKDGCRPHLALSQPMRLRGGEDAAVRLDGLLIGGHRVEVPAAGGNRLARLELRHCTLVPGRELEADLTPRFVDDAALVAELPDLQIEAERCVLGALWVEPQASVRCIDCVIDATDPERVAYAGLDGRSEGAHLSIAQSTVVGRVHARRLDASNTIFLAVAATSGLWVAPVRVARRQQGCVRFCWLPPASRTPSRFQCLPESAPSPADATPRFTSLRFGHPAYAQLAASSGARLLTGADDESEPGVFHHVHAAQRETNLRVRLDEYLRAGLEAGIFYEN